jgi:uroporphyrinogen decarboxylase
MLRQIILPQHQRLVDLAHRADKLFFLHSCGNLESIMPDIIGIGVDAKHSFEDKILPVEQAYQRWGEQIGIVGGLDMDLMARGSEAEVRRRTREILDVCALKGGYALGTGNSVADYVPVSNFQAMLDEGQKWNREHFPQHAL